MLSPQKTQFAYRLVREGSRIFYSLLYGLEFKGRELVPQNGGVIIASNHTSLIDPPLLATAVPRQVHFIAKKDLFEIPVIGSILGHCGCIWVDRDNKDGSSVNQAIEYLENGHVVGIFPEGTRSKDGKLGRGKLGAAFIALKTGLPVVPTCIFNAYEIGNNHCIPCGRKLVVRFGESFSFPKSEDVKPKDLKMVINKIMGSIADLQNLGIDN